MNGGVMFRAVVTSTGGESTPGTVTEAYVLDLFRRAVRYGCSFEASQDGGVIIVRTVMITGCAVAGRRVVALEPVTPAGVITAQQREDLEIIGRRRGKRAAARFNPATGRIDAGVNSIPVAAARRLMERGLVVALEDEVQVEAPYDVGVSLAARLAMLAQDHETRAGIKRGSTARCACGWYSEADAADVARSEASGHRQQVAGEWVRVLLRDAAEARGVDAASPAR